MAKKEPQTNKIRISAADRVFHVCNTIFLIALALVCILPIINILAISLSGNASVTAGLVTLWPVDFTINSYKYVAMRVDFWRSMGVSLLRCALGVSINVFMCVITAYPLSKSTHRFKARTAYAWFFFLTMLLNGGLIPWFMTIKSLNLLGTIWALVLPGAVPVFSVVLMLNFFRGIPEELEEAAVMDGANAWQRFRNVTLPFLAPAFTYCIPLWLAGGFRMFDYAAVATNGGPGSASTTMTYYIYKYLFPYNKVGYGQTVAMIYLAVCIVISTFVTNKLRKREIDL